MCLVHICCWAGCAFICNSLKAEATYPAEDMPFTFSQQAAVLGAGSS